MKRGKRPFTVEVRRGGKRPALNEPDTSGMSIDPDVLRRAEEALGQTTRHEMPSASAETDKPKGRILPNLTEPPAEIPLAEEIPAPRRRGRPPGSKNKLKAGSEKRQIAGPPKRRGRPPKVQSSPVTRPVWFTPPTPVRPAAIAATPSVWGEPAGAEQPLELARLPRMERRMSQILGRWVYGTVPTRGERWKRRLR